MNRQRGAISILAAATMVVAILAVALALDIGRIIHERQQLQRVVDAAALAGARALAAEGIHAAATAAAQAAAAQNGEADSLAIDIGHLVHVGGLRTFASGPGAAPPAYQAVQVTATRKVPRSLVAGALLSGDDPILTARAVAQQQNEAGFRIGSKFASVNNDLLDGVLGGLLGTQIDILSYDALLEAHVTLKELLDLEARAGSLDELLAMDMQVSEFLNLVVRALQQQGDLAAATLNSITAGIDPSLHLEIGELLGVSNDSSSLTASLNVFDLLMASAQLAREGHAIDVDLDSAGTLLSELGLVDLDIKIKVVEAPKIAAGPPGRNPLTNDWYTKAQTGQVDLQINLRTLDLNLLGLVTTKVELNLFLQAASAEAWLVAIDAPRPSTPHTRVHLGARTEVARIGIGTPTVTGVTPAQLLNARVRVLGLPVADITASANADAILGQSEASQPHTLTFDGPFVPTIPAPLPANTRTIGTSVEQTLSSGLATLLLNTDIDVDVKVLSLHLPVGLTDNAIVQALRGILSPLLNTLATGLLSPLLEQLGLQIGGADVTVLHASAGEVRLVQ